MSTGSKKAKKGQKGDNISPDQIEELEDLVNNPKDDESRTVRSQIESISKTLAEHSEALSALKDVPNLLVNLMGSMNHAEQCDASSEGNNSDCDEDNDLLTHFIDSKNDANEQSNEINGGDPDMLEILNLSQPESEYGAALSEVVAKSFAQMIRSHPKKERIEKWKDEFRPPENCKIMGTPRVNTEVWPHLKQRARHTDLAYQQHAGYLTQAMVATGRLADKIFSSGISKEVGQELLKMTMDIGGILGLASQELSNKRKADIKIHHKEYAALCSSKSVPTEWLFGDNVLEQLKASKSAASVMKPTPQFSSRNQRFQPYRARNNLNFRRPPFQMRGGMNQAPFRQSFSKQQFPRPGPSTQR